MKYFMANLSANLVALASIGGAVYLISNDKNGYGWLLLLAFLSQTSNIFTDSTNNDE